MKKIKILAYLLISVFINAQKADGINKIYPAAPSANNLMKFEEIPVSYYTGVPDINIPIHTAASEKIQIPVGLSYHTQSAKPDDYASEVGLGWNLITGGTIARTVKGLPDEAVKDNLGSGRQGIGIYIDEYSNHPNFTANYRNHIATYLNMISSGTLPYTEPDFMKIGFEAGVFNRYDSHYDIYQYNFLGYTGRFIIKKNSTNQFEVVKLDINNLKITSQHNNKYEPISFTIVDEQGRQYTFDVLEKTRRSFMVDKVSQLYSNYMPQTNVGQIDDYNSAFHLSSIKNDGGLELATFEYNEPNEINIPSTTITNNFPVYSQNYEDYIKQQIDPYLPPRTQTYTTNSLSSTKTLKRISIPGSEKIDFKYVGNDPLLGFEAVPLVLSEILVKDNSEKITEKFSFNQQINTFPVPAADRKRMKLREITKKSFSNNIISKYTLNYYPSAPLNSTKDPWGFAKCGDFDNNCLYSDVLQSITYPTGGKTEFNYSENTFSYAAQSPGGTMPLIGNYQGNIYNWIIGSGGVAFDRFKEPEKFMFKIDTEQDVSFNYFMSSLPGSDWRLELYKGDGQVTSTTPTYFIGTLYDGITTTEGYITRHMPPGYYYAKLETDDLSHMFDTFNWVAMNVSYKEYKTTDIQKFLYGGGFNIGSMRYLDQDGSLIREKTFSYMDPSDPMQSSGALVYPYPVLNYEDSFAAKLWYMVNGNSFYESVNYNNSFKVRSSENLIPTYKTKGSNVGYEYVTVYETGKGKTINKYTSPRAFPNSEYVNTAPPFLPVLDEDYKRGNFIKEEIKNNNGVLLKDKTLDYNIRTENLITGLNFRTSPYDVYLSQFDTYEDFLYYKQNCGTLFNGIKCAYIESTVDFPIQYEIEKTIISKVNNTGSETKEYYENQPNSFIRTKEETVYNSLDLPEQIKVTAADNTVIEKRYKYAHEKNNQLLISKNMISIPLETTTTQTIGNVTKTIDKSETIYPTSLPTTQTGNLVLPLFEKSYDKLNNNASTDVSYDKYDEKGNILQYTTKDGIPVSIVWGYNKTQPIAKIEGIAYDQLTVGVSIAGIISASNDDAADPTKEGLLLEALNSFRKESALSGKKITTYTYDPLIGVTSITPPSGVRQTFTYDTANRLKETGVRGKNNSGTYINKKISEHNYNYKH
ncbi:hypothetical protein [Sphingobacterium sp.]|uniref:hypothetical protein n=1 Tax=Sphingobacterium sp. TaxID=341027 RepID=UPI002FD9F473